MPRHTSLHLGITPTVLIMARFYRWVGPPSSPFCRTAQVAPSALTTSSSSPSHLSETSTLPASPTASAAAPKGLPSQQLTSRPPAPPTFSIDQHITLRGCPGTLRSVIGLHFNSTPTRAVYDRLSVNKDNTIPYHPSTNGGVERIKYISVQMPSLIVTEQ